MVFRSFVVDCVAVEIQVPGACTNENRLDEKGYLVPSSWSTIGKIVRGWIASADVVCLQEARRLTVMQRRLTKHKHA